MNQDFNKQFESTEINVKAPAWWVSHWYESAADAGRSVAAAALQAIPVKTWREEKDVLIVLSSDTHKPRGGKYQGNHTIYSL